MNRRARILLLASTVLSLATAGLAQTATKASAPKARLVPTEVWVDVAYGPSTPGWQVTRFDRIQDGLDGVGDRGTVWVAAGTYGENPVLDRPVRLWGEDPLTTIVLGGAGPVLSVGSGEVEVRRLTLTRSGDPVDVGVRFTASSSAVLECVISSHQHGVLVDPGVVQTLIEGCTISQSSIGIRLERSSGETVIRTNRLGANTSHDVSLNESRDNVITANTLESEVYYGIDLYRSHDNELSDNTLKSHTKDIHLQESNGNRIFRNAISGFGYTGIELYSSSNNIVQGNTIRDQYAIAASISYGSNNQFLDNLIEGNDYGVTISGTQSIVARNRMDKGLRLTGSVTAQIVDNTLTSRGLTLSGTQLENWTGHVIDGNTLNGGPIYYFDGVAGPGEFQAPGDAASVIFAACDNVAVRGLPLSRGGSVQVGFSTNVRIESNVFGLDAEGVLLTSSTAVQVSNNQMTSVLRSIEASGCGRVTVAGNMIDGADGVAALSLEDSSVIGNRFVSSGGVSLAGARVLFEGNAVLETKASGPTGPEGLIALSLGLAESTVRKNRISTRLFEPPATGIRLSRSSGNLIEWNDVLHHRDGMMLRSSSSNVVRSNLFAANHLESIRVSSSTDNRIEENVILGSSYGFSVASSSLRNVFTGNTVADHRQGAILGDRDNQVFGNSFVNLLNAWDTSTNTWDDGVGAGNYWSDYTGSDGDGDGVGDVPYAIPGGSNADRFPLTTPPGPAVLFASAYRLSAGAGGTIELSLHAGATQAGRSYVLLGSATGRDPGTPLPGGLAELPLTWDRYTDLVLANLNTSPFAGFAGQLDAFGEATARLSLPTLPPGLAGTTYYYAYALSNPWNVTSNPVPIELSD